MNGKVNQVNRNENCFVIISNYLVPIKKVYQDVEKEILFALNFH